ncbi:unnamed protein product, partial [Schistosoma margrebowiei]
MNLVIDKSRNDPYKLLLKEFPELVNVTYNKADLKHSIQHRIVTNSPPINARPRRLNPKRLAIAKQEFDKLMRLGIVSPSNSPQVSYHIRYDKEVTKETLIKFMTDGILLQEIKQNTRTEAVFLKPRAPFKLAAFNVRTLVQVGQQIGLAMSLESLNIDVCCLSETRIQDSGEVLQIRSPSVASKSLFYVRLSGDPVASSSGLAGVGVALSFRAEAALVDWIPINSRLCAVRLESSIK